MLNWLAEDEEPQTVRPRAWTVSSRLTHRTHADGVGYLLLRQRHFGRWRADRGVGAKPGPMNSGRC
jgi:hypothetical protein